MSRKPSRLAAAILAYEAFLQKYGPVQPHVSQPPASGYSGHLKGQPAPKHHCRHLPPAPEVHDRPSPEPDEMLVHEPYKMKCEY